MRNRMHLTAAALVAVVGVLVAPPALAASTGGVANIAHRGASTSAPENTLASVAQGIADRADFIEFDVQLTKDGVPVVLHDPTLARTTDVETVFPRRSPWRLRDFTLAEVESLDAGSWMAGSYAHERVPTLAALLRQLSHSPSGAYLEVKHPADYGGVDGIGAEVYDTVKAVWPAALSSQGQPRLVVMSFDEGFIRDFAARYPDVTVGVLGPSDTAQVATFADDVEPYYTNVTADSVGAAHNTGLTVTPWTVDDTVTMSQLVAAGVDGIITNHPALLRGVLESKGDVDSATAWPAEDTQSPAWTLTTTGRHLNSPVTVRAALVGAGGEPARWQWSALQQWVGGAWRTVLQRATDAAGRFSATLPGSAGLRLRVVNLQGGPYPAAASAVADVPLKRLGSTVGLSAPAFLHQGLPATLTVRWESSDGRPLSGVTRLYRRRPDGSWQYLRDLRLTAGYARTRVLPRSTTTYEVRCRAGWWYTRAGDVARVKVLRRPAAS